MYDINIEIGTKNEFRYSNGNVLPLVAVPFAMQSFVLQSNGGSDSNEKWFYNPEAKYAEGIRLTNQPSPWLGDYGHIIMMPSTEEKYDFWNMYSSIRSKVLNPWYMSVDFVRYSSQIEVVPHEYGGKVRINYTSGKKQLILRNYQNKLDVKIGDNFVELTNWDIPKSNYGKNSKKYYKLYFDTNIVNHENIVEDNFGGVIIEFKDNTVEYDIITSYISFEQCDITRERYLGNFEEARDSAKNKWEEIFNLFDIDKKDDLFYSNVYRAFLFPHIMHEIDAKNEIKHHSFYTEKVEDGFMYTDVGFWDIYRSSMPLVYKFLPERYTEIVKGVLNVYKESGWLPRWLAPFERGIMPSTLVDPTVAHAIVNDIYDENEKQVAIEALLKNANVECDDELHGRKLLNSYLELGYISNELAHESVSRTLDNCYSDYCIALALESMGMDRQVYLDRSKYYLNVLDKNDMFFKPKDSNGNFQADFSPYEWGTSFCESDALTNNFSVHHDIEHFLSLWNKDQLEERLDLIFNQEMKYEIGKYGSEIHEMTEALNLDFGYTGISNQPGFNLPFVFYFMDDKERLEYYLDKTISLFENDIEGYPGDEDNGSMSAYYIWLRLREFPYDVMKDNIKF